MLALSLLDGVIAVDWQGVWLSYASTKGYLQSVCASLQWDDEVLIRMISPVPESLKTLYIYECKMVKHYTNISLMSILFSMDVFSLSSGISDQSRIQSTGSKRAGGHEQLVVS